MLSSFIKTIFLCVEDTYFWFFEPTACKSNYGENFTLVRVQGIVSPFSEIHHRVEGTIICEIESLEKTIIIYLDIFLKRVYTGCIM